MQFESIICSSRLACAVIGNVARPVVRFARESDFRASNSKSFMNFNAGTVLRDATQFEAQRREMVALQIRDRGIRSENVLAALSRVPRHEFVPLTQMSAAYSDNALLIGDGQTISQPYVVAAMTEALSLTGSERVLEVGGGSGYQAAVLSTLAQEIIVMELLPRLAEAARERLARLGCSKVSVIQADGSLGWAAGAPYDAILVAAGAPAIPPPLVDQLAEGGRLVIPLGSADEQKLVCVVKRDGCLTQRVLFACRFVPLRGRYGWRTETQETPQE
jgi:protein-L-isoaspartate(D-aspartate) O-methyltransferase